MNQPRHLNWAGQPVGNWGYGGREENIPVHMGVSTYTVSRMARRAKKAGWLDKVRRRYVIVGARK
jgi:hypothetical protein